MILFNKTPDDMRAFAAYVAQLTKEGVVYRIVNHEDYISIELTGGF